MTGAGTAIYWNSMPHSGVVIRGRPERRGRRPLRRDRHRSGLGLDPGLPTRRRSSASTPRTCACIRPTPTSPRWISAPTRRASRLMCGMAAIQAAERLREAIFKAVARKLGVEPSRLVARDRKVGVPDDWDRAMAFPRGGRAGRVDARRARLRRVLRAAQAGGQVQGRRCRALRPATRTRPAWSSCRWTRRRARSSCTTCGSPTTSGAPSTRSWWKDRSRAPCTWGSARR